MTSRDTRQISRGIEDLKPLAAGMSALASAVILLLVQGSIQVTNLTTMLAVCSIVAGVPFSVVSYFLLVSASQMSTLTQRTKTHIAFVVAIGGGLIGIGFFFLLKGFDVRLGFLFLISTVASLAAFIWVRGQFGDLSKEK